MKLDQFVGSTDSVNFCDAALAFCIFYLGIHRGANFASLIPAVQAASGISDFNVGFGHLVHNEYSQRLRESMAALFQNLEQSQVQRQPTADQSPLLSLLHQPEFFNSPPQGGQ